MKIFIGGTKSIEVLAPKAKSILIQISGKGYSVLVGDCYGVDASVQKFYSDVQYDDVTVYANNGYARNNIGEWKVKSVIVPQNIRGAEYYRQKDIAMAIEADYGFMIWDGQSKGTLNNIVALVSRNKKVLVYLSINNTVFYIQNDRDLYELINRCPYSTQSLYMLKFQERQNN